MSKKRPTEVSWDSDDDLLQDDISGINAFPHSKKEELEEELDEDALLGSDDETGGKDFSAEENETSYTRKGDISKTSDVANSTFGASETDDYQFVDEGMGEEFMEDVIEIEPEVDSSLLIDSQDDTDLVEESNDYSSQENEEAITGFDSTADTTQELNTTEVEPADDDGGDDSSSESDGEGGRIRFKSERASIVSLSQSKSRTDIPDTLEISEEQQATIDEFLTKDGRRKNQRGGRGRGPRGRQPMQHQQRQPMSGPGGYNRNPPRHPAPHMMRGGYRPTLSPQHETQQNSQRGPILSTPSSQHPPNTGQSRPRTILINPHFRGPSAASSAPDTTVTWSHQSPAPRQPQVTNPPSFPPPVIQQPPYPVTTEPNYSRQSQHTSPGFADLHRSHDFQRMHEPYGGPDHHTRAPDPHRSLDLHRGVEPHIPMEPSHDQYRGIPMDHRPGFNPNVPHKEPFHQGPPYPIDEHRRLYPGYSPQGPPNSLSQPNFPPGRQSPRYGQPHAPPPHGVTPLQPLSQPLLDTPPSVLGGLPHGMPHHQPHSAPGMLNVPPRQAFVRQQPSGHPNEPYFNNHPNPPYPHGHSNSPSGMPMQPGHPGGPPQRQAYLGRNTYPSQQNERPQLNRQQQDPAIAFGLLQPPQNLTNQRNQPHSQRSSQPMGGPRSFPNAQQQQQHQRQHVANQFQQSNMQNRENRFPRGQGQQTQPVQRRGRPGVQPQTQPNNNNNNITLVNAIPLKRLSMETPTGASPPKVPKNQGRKNVRDRLQLPGQQQTNTPVQQKQQPVKRTPEATQPAKLEEPEDEATRELNKKIEEQKRLRAEIIKRKEARRLQQAQARRSELQKKLAQQGMTLSDVEGSGNSAAQHQTPPPQQAAPQQNTPQKKVVPKKVSPGQPRQGQMVATKRQGPNTGQMQMFNQEPPNKMFRQMSQPGQHGQMDGHPNQGGQPGPQTGNQAGFNRQNSRGRGGFVRGQRGAQRGGMTRQFSGGNNVPIQATPAQPQLRQVKIQSSQQAFVNQNNNRNVMIPGQQSNVLPKQGQAGRGQIGKVQNGSGQGQAGRGQMGQGQGQIQSGQTFAMRGRGQVVVRGRGQVQRGRGQPVSVQVSTSSGQGLIGRGQIGKGQVGRGQGQVGRGQGQVGRGQDQVGRGQGQVGRGQGQAAGGQMAHAQVQRGRGQVVVRGRGQVQRGRGQAVVRQVSTGGQTASQAERTVVARSVSGNNIVLGAIDTNAPNQNASRRVVVGPNVNQGSQYVSVDNLSTSTTKEKLTKLCSSVGPVESVQLIQSQNKAIIKFQTPNHSHLFAKKFDRYLLDLSSIRVSTLPT